MATAGTKHFNLDAALWGVAVSGPTTAPVPETNPQDKEYTKVMSTEELETLCIMCGKPHTNTLEHLLGMYSECAEKNASKCTSSLSFRNG